MADKRVYVTQLDGGLDDDIASSQIDEKSAVDILNTRWTSGGIITKRDGWEFWGAAMTTPKALGRYVNGTTREILAIDGTALKKTTTGSTWTTITGATFDAAATDYSLPMIKKKTYIWNGVDAGRVYDGSTLAIPGTMPSANHSTYYKGYHIAYKNSRLYFSTIANTDDFTNDPAATTDGPDPDNSTEVPGATIFTGTVPDVAQFVDISPSDGDDITMVIDFQDYLIIGKTNSVWSLTIDAVSKKPVIQLITRAIGCISQKSAVAVGNDVYCMSEQGPMSVGNEKNFNGAIRTNLLGAKITGLIANINKSQWKRITAVHADNMYLVSIPYKDSAIINRVIAMDTRSNGKGGWTVWENIDARAWLSHVDSANKRHLYFLKEGELTISEMLPGHYYDNGKGIDAYWKSKAIDAGALDVTKRWTYFTIFMRNIGATADVAIATEMETLEPVNIFDGATGSGIGFSSWGTGAWIGLVNDSNGSGADTSLTSSDDAWRTNPNLEARTFSFTVRNNKPGENFALAGFAAEYITLKAYYFDQSHTF